MTDITKQRFVRISGGALFLTPEVSLPLWDTNLNPDYMRFKPGQNFCWKTEIVDYDSVSKKVKLKVIDYYPLETEAFNSQKLKMPVAEVEFELLDWKKLEPQLSFYQYNQMLVILDNLEAESLSNKVKVPAVGALGVSTAFDKAEFSEAQESSIPVKKTRFFSERFTCFYTDATFLTGCVKVLQNFKWTDNPVTITLENSSILAEFDLVKSFFHKVHDGRKKFDVFAEFEVTDGEITEIKAFSPQIAAIGDQFIEGVKQARMHMFLKKSMPSVDKSLFTADEFFSHHDEFGEKGNTFNTNEMELLLASIAESSLRNRRQIEYLAGGLHSPEQKIRFTLKPVFGFVFCINGQTMNHFCWELLNSHATYLWSFDKASGNIKEHYQRVEIIIAGIRETGRELYKQHFRLLPPEPDMVFSVINHTNAGSDLKDGFPEWKHRLLERLV